MNFDLQKKSHKISEILLQKGIANAPVMRVAVALDVSYSMSSIIASGALQTAFNQLMGVAVKFDDDGELDVFKFDTSCEYVGTSAPVDGDFDKFIKNNGIAPRGGTAYEPIVAASMKKFFGGSETKKVGGFLGFGGKTVTTASSSGDNTPVLMLIITDGEPSDARDALDAMRATVDQPIYFHMVGIGGLRNNFPTIAKMADELPNVGEVYLPTLTMSDAAIYEQLICDELVEFVGRFSQPSQATA